MNNNKIILEEDDFIDGYIPERNLLAALLDRAIMDYWTETDRRIKRETRAWFNRTPVKASKPFSFQYVCEQLDLSPKEMWINIQKLDTEHYKRHR